MRISIALAILAAGVCESSNTPRQYGVNCSSKPLVDAKLVDTIKSAALLKGAQDLQDLAFKYPEKNRLMGSNGHNDTVKYLVKELEALNGYYTVETQKFASLVQTGGNATLRIDDKSEPWGMMEYSPSGSVNGTLVVVNNLGCDPSDYPSTLKGNIALISRGTCEFGLKSALAGAAGASGALIYNNIPGLLNGSTLGVPPRPQGPYIPTLGISREKGLEIIDQINAGTRVSSSFTVNTVIETYTTNNVLATSVCGAQNSTLVLGAHTDSVDAGPGINDDGSGTIGILEVAKQLSKYNVNNAVRFGFWSGEESGLLGSTFWVNSLSTAQLSNIRAYLNFDMIASPNYIHAIYDGDGSSNTSDPGPIGSAEIERFFENYFNSTGNNFTDTAFDGRSDYGPFIEIGIPAGGTFTGAEEIKTKEEEAKFGGTSGQPLDPNYHGAGDKVDNLDLGAFELHGKAIAASVAEYATSFKGLPPKQMRKRGAAISKRGGKRWGDKWIV